MKRTRLVCFVLVALWSTADARLTRGLQRSPGSPLSSKGASGSDSKKQVQALRDFQAKLVTALDSATNDTSDYVPCEFTVEQLMMLRAKPEVVRLSSYDEERLKETVISQALAQANAGAFDDGQEVVFVKNLSEAPLEGLTPSEALAKIIFLLNAATAPSQRAAKLASAASRGKDAFVQEAANLLPDQYRGQASKLLSDTVSGERPEDVIRSASTSGLAALNKSNIDVSTLAPALAEAQAAVAVAGPQAVVEAARATISSFQRPPDIACAMSILDWNTTRYGFGVTIADQYIGIQIVIRNLNANQEFLVHDAELAVDTDFSNKHGRFFSGVDKLTVRGFSIASRDYGRRNFLTNLAQGVGTVLSAVTPIYGTVMKDVSSVYNSGFLSAMNSVWKDHNTDQLNLLNDVGFSASKTDRTVVPKSGTVMFVIFVEAKQFEQGWWTQPCASSTVLSRSASATQVTGTAAVQQDGIDMGALKAICQQDSPNVGRVSSGDSTINYTKPPKAVPYKKWSPNAGLIFRELTFAVIAGTHILEQKSTTPSLTNIDCPKDAQGNLDLANTATSSITCKLTGANLDKVSSLRLRNAQDQTDTKTADGSVTVSGDSTTGNVSFLVSQLCILEKPAYKVFTETKDGVENGGNQSVKVNLEPFLTANPDPGSVSLDKLVGSNAAPSVVKLTGCHLDKAVSVHLESPPYAMDTDKPLSYQGSTGLSFGITPAMMAKAKIPAADYSPPNQLKFEISLVSKDARNTLLPTGKNLEGTGQVSGAPTVKPQLSLTAPQSITSGSSTTVGVTAKTSDGKIDTAFVGTVKFTTTDKSATLPADYTFVLADKGTHNFTIVLETKGSQTVTASSSGRGSASATVVVK